MKYVLIFVFCLFSFLFVKSQGCSHAYYQNAINYIANDTTLKCNSSINISDTVRFFDYVYFIDNVKFDCFNDKYSYTFTNIETLDNYLRFKPTYDSFLSKFKSSGCCYLFFSRPFCNTLIVEVFYSNKKNALYSDLCLYNESLRMLFVFDNNHNIIHCCKVKVAYD